MQYHRTSVTPEIKKFARKKYHNSRTIIITKKYILIKKQKHLYCVAEFKFLLLKNGKKLSQKVMTKPSY